MARPNKGLAHVDALPGDPEQKYRLKVLLATLTGELLVDEACDELDLGPTQLAHLRRQMLLGALEALAPRPAGRPRRRAEVSPEEVEELRHQVAELERERQLMRARLELALLPIRQSRTKSPMRRGTAPRSADPAP